MLVVFLDHCVGVLGNKFPIRHFQEFHAVILASSVLFKRIELNDPVVHQSADLAKQKLPVVFLFNLCVLGVFNTRSKLLHK